MGLLQALGLQPCAIFADTEDRSFEVDVVKLYSNFLEILQLGVSILHPKI